LPVYQNTSLSIGKYSYVVLVENLGSNDLYNKRIVIAIKINISRNETEQTIVEQANKLK
jgi:hypothetical protein